MTDNEELTALLNRAIAAFDALDNAYETNHRQYHNYTYWEDEQYDRLQAQYDERHAIGEAFKTLAKLRK